MVDYPIGTCANCELPDRVLKYARRTMCRTYACQRAASALVAERKAARRNGVASGTGVKPVAPTFCHKIIRVHGVQDFNPASLVGAERRNTVAKADMKESYLILGLFKEHERDSGINDIRWVELEDLVVNLSKQQLKPIVEYEKKLHESKAAKRQKISDEMEADA